MRRGYVLVKRDGDPRADAYGYVREHLLVARSALGRPLPDGACVHHVNGDRSDNRGANLVICQDSAYHNLLHRRQRALEACGHADWRVCWICGEHDDPRNMWVWDNPNKAQAHHRKCQAAYHRRSRRSRKKRDSAPPNEDGPANAWDANRA